MNPVGISQMPPIPLSRKHGHIRVISVIRGQKRLADPRPGPLTHHPFDDFENLIRA